MFNFWNKPFTNDLLPELAALTLQAVFPLSEINGALVVNVQPAIRNSDSKEIIQFRLTATGEPKSSNLDDILSCFDAERNWIVRSFLEMTTAKMHQVWGIK